ncbi:MAG: PTS sugar transporter subunit IIA [Candidatus Aceula meridiana]|nr:PTS sugar transporter subunit IIA [Candidatus Aceula meridiana]
MTIVDISQYIEHSHIVLDVKARTKEGVIAELVEKIYQKEGMATHPVSKEKACAEVVSREKTQTTAIGSGLAFPHARIDGWGQFKIAMGISRQGIDFDSVDKKPVKIIFLFISDSAEPYLVLQAMSAIIRFLNDQNNIEKLLKEDLSAQALADKFKKFYVSTPNQILARDLARPVKDITTLETPIDEATRIMHMKHIDILPVVDDCRRFCGELSCLEVFQYGMPDFFKQLNTISFVRHIDPFEKYFHIRKNLKVKDLYIKNVDVLFEDKTLVEIIFEMTVKKRSHLFVVREDKTLIGVIDRFTIIDKILFF